MQTYTINALTTGSIAQLFQTELQAMHGDYVQRAALQEAQTVKLARVKNASTGSGQFPPVARQIKTASNALIRAAGALLTGQKVKAPEAVIEERKAICGGCEFLKDNRCLKCGCWYKTKITLATESCPEKKWGTVGKEEAKYYAETSPEERAKNRTELKQTFEEIKKEYAMGQ
jgi:hypothetical protein